MMSNIWRLMSSVWAYAYFVRAVPYEYAVFVLRPYICDVDESLIAQVVARLGT